VISRATLVPWMRRPVALVAFALVALAALLSGGLVVARAVDGTPATSTSSSPTPAGGSNGANNVAAAVNTKDGTTVYAIKLKIVQVSGSTVDPTNAAIAVNSGCTGCSTVAVAFEGVVVVGSPTTFAPTNLALAYNAACSGCVAFADAYQQVVQSSTRVRVTKEGRREIARIRKDLDSLKHSALTLEQIRARVAADEQAFATVLSTQLVPVGHVQDAAPADAPDVSDSPDAAPADPSTAATPASSTPTSDPTQTSSGAAPTTEAPTPTATSSP
jgi:putative peptide zinc metalloprotease protein